MSVRYLLILLLACGMTATGCDSDPDDTSPGAEGEGEGEGEGEDQGTYSFTGRDGTSSVAYGGQVFRHALIVGMKGHLSAMTERIDTGAFTPAAGDVLDELMFYYAFDDADGAEVPHGISTDPPPAQTTFGELGSDKDLQGKIAGNDPTGQHQDWGTDGVAGWGDAELLTPDQLAIRFMQAVDDLAVARAQGNVPLGPDGGPITSVFVDELGRDYQQLLQKYLLGAVAFSQGADDYLDDDTEGKGLLSDHTTLVEGKTYTALEHQWDEGFGYFGAARNYDAYTDDEIAAKGGRDGWSAGHHDTNGDGVIDFESELNWGHSVNAAKRDRGSVVATDFTADAFEGFVRGRALLAETTEALTPSQLDDLRAARDQALDAWEKAFAATVVHYINSVIRDMNTDAYDFAAHAKHWGEMKGFALSFQFSRHSPVTAEAFDRIHTLMGTAPALPGQPEWDTYAADLLEARQIIGDAFEFDAANLGDENGENGW